MMISAVNPQIELAFEYVSYTNKNIFLTGKAGTGKTTFLGRVREEVPKRVAVVAPTGVAAINAGGVTIHSLFQLPFGPLVPGSVRDKMNQRRFNTDKIKLLKSLDLLVIDEISMVRADVLDAIDEVLRRYRNNPHPFGGLQLLMIGDLHQLPPVVKPQEWAMLGPYYDTPYFFSSLALKKTDAVTIELKHIYRQADSDFIALLNKVRDNRMDNEVFSLLNSRYLPDQVSEKQDEYITLTSHNAAAQSINNEKLGELPSKLFLFEAKIEGDFPQHAYPCEVNLEVKEGAQVMFTKNDPSPSKEYYNGKIGRITRIQSDKIWVQSEDDDYEILVMPVDWKNVKYSLNEESKEIKEDTIGTFIQYPLKLAWAITIHKSQGLTFEKVIIDAQAAFAHGQVYVALSRCKTFEGILLRSPLRPTSVKTDHLVRNYTETARQNEPDEQQLEAAKKDFQQHMLLDFFQFDLLKRSFNQLHRILSENEKKFQGGAPQAFHQLLMLVQEEVFEVAEKFIPQLHAYFSLPAPPEENDALKARLAKAGGYFYQKLRTQVLEKVEELPLLSDNKAVLKNAKEKHASLCLALKIACAEALICQNGFDSKAFSQAAANAEIDFQQKGRPAQKGATNKLTLTNISHPDLYQELHQWRAKTADFEEMERYTVAPTKTLLEIVQVLPTSMLSLKHVHGIGKKRAQRFGGELVGIVKKYVDEHQLESDLMEFATGKAPSKKASKPKVDSKKVSLELFQQGKSVEEIAKERELVQGTIRGHLAHFVEEGELDIHLLIPKEKLKAIATYFATAEDEGLALAKTQLGDLYDYGELRLGRWYFHKTNNP